jgi:hypothetical protein
VKDKVCQVQDDMRGTQMMTMLTIRGTQTRRHLFCPCPGGRLPMPMKVPEEGPPRGRKHTGAPGGSAGIRTACRGSACWCRGVRAVRRSEEVDWSGSGVARQRGGDDLVLEGA